MAEKGITIEIQGRRSDAFQVVEGLQTIGPGDQLFVLRLADVLVDAVTEYAYNVGIGKEREEPPPPVGAKGNLGRMILTGDQYNGNRNVGQDDFIKVFQAVDRSVDCIVGLNVLFVSFHGLLARCTILAVDHFPFCASSDRPRRNEASTERGQEVGSTAQRPIHVGRVVLSDGPSGTAVCFPC